MRISPKITIRTYLKKKAPTWPRVTLGETEPYQGKIDLYLKSIQERAVTLHKYIPKQTVNALGLDLFYLVLFHEFHHVLAGPKDLEKDADQFAWNCFRIFFGGIRLFQSGCGDTSHMNDLRTELGQFGSTDPVIRFQQKIQRNPVSGCWEWTGSLTTGGYAQLRVGKRKVAAHRFSYELHIGKIPKGLSVCHKCDNPKCVNPFHLFLGTHKDNMADCTRKKRRLGERNANAKLNVSNVQEIKTSRLNASELGRRFGVTKEAIYAVRSGRNWPNV